MSKNFTKFARMASRTSKLSSLSPDPSLGRGGRGEGVLGGISEPEVLCFRLFLLIFVAVSEKSSNFATIT